MITIKKGNLLTAFESGEIDVMIHGCNCYCTMGGGIAKQIKEKYPGAYKVDCKTKKGDSNKLGSLSIYEHEGKFIINAYTQDTYWDIHHKFSYKALELCLKAIKKDFSGYKMGLPRIGAGLAEGCWNDIFEIINNELSDENVTIYEL